MACSEKMKWPVKVNVPFYIINLLYLSQAKIKKKIIFYQDFFKTETLTQGVSVLSAEKVECEMFLYLIVYYFLIKY